MHDISSMESYIHKLPWHTLSRPVNMIFVLSRSGTDCFVSEILGGPVSHEAIIPALGPRPGPNKDQRAEDKYYILFSNRQAVRHGRVGVGVGVTLCHLCLRCIQKVEFCPQNVK